MSLTIVPTQVLGIKYQGFLNSQKAICLKNPDAYVTQRNAILESLTNTVIDAMYVRIQALLTTGEMKDLDKPFQPKNPSYPPQKINDVILNVVGQLAEGLNQIVDIVCPEEYLKYTDSKLNIQAKGSAVA
jgi:hypothetical protein